MKIRQLELKNFRCFDQKTFEFSDQFNVLIGDNGTGKTTTLDALSLIVGKFLSSLTGVYESDISKRKDRIKDSDIRQVRNDGIEYILPVEISCRSVINEVEIDWSIYVERFHGSNTWVRPLSSIDFADNLRERMERDDIINLPLVIHYGTARLWGIKKNPLDLDQSVRQHRFLGYTDSLETNPNLILGWFRFEDLKILLGQESLAIHEAISNALTNCAIDSWTSMNYDANEDTLIVRSLDGKSQQFVKLSDGVRNMIGMVADIAYRSVVLNPHLGSNAPRETQGVVLIDEIDLNLHPKWQRRVVDDLKHTFPKIQFIATTHSEHIIQSLREGELIDLNNSDSMPEAEYENKSIEDIDENIMHVPNPYRSERYQKMMEVAQKYYQVLQEVNGATSEEAERLKLQLDELIEPFSDNVAYHAFLQMKRAAMLDEE